MTENQEKALKMFIAAAEKFIAKCEDGRASSVVTYREMKAALALAKDTK